jgi:hypothetical protein
MGIIQKLHRKWRMSNAVLRKYYLTTPAMEVIYRELFIRDLQKLQIDDVFYPIGGAANHGLFYVIARCFIEFEIKNAIELGAGQTSILMSQLSSRYRDRINIRTVEHDAQWAEYIRPKVGHELFLAHLVDKTIGGHRISHYASGYFDKSTKYDFVLIDGPPAYREDILMNRLGAVEIIQDNLAGDFVLIVDDAERPGEGALIDAIRRELKNRRVGFREIAIAASKRQHLFCAGAYARAVYF